jgi:hypothetical protein
LIKGILKPPENQKKACPLRNFPLNNLFFGKSLDEAASRNWGRSGFGILPLS